jgi:hypothetical protein
MNKTLKAVREGKGLAGKQMLEAPVAMGPISKIQDAQFSNGSRPGTIKVSKREYVADIAALASTFEVVADLVINPGNELLFPWLSIFSAAYESYKFLKLAFSYEPEAPTTEPGYVALAIEYDPSEDPPTSKVKLMEMEETVRAPLWSEVKHVSTRKNLSKRKSYFLRPTQEPPELQEVDESLYDTGRLLIATGNSSGDLTSAGELWVDYEVEFMTPQLGLSGAPGKAYYTLGSSEGYSITQPLGTEPFVYPMSTPDCWEFSSAHSYARLTYIGDIPWRPVVYGVYDTTTTATHGYTNAGILTAIGVSTNGGAAVSPVEHAVIAGAGATSTHGINLWEPYEDIGRPFRKGDYLSFAATAPTIGTASPILIGILDMPVDGSLGKEQSRRGNWILKKSGDSVVRCHNRQELAGGQLMIRETSQKSLTESHDPLVAMPLPLIASSGRGPRPRKLGGA